MRNARDDLAVSGNFRCNLDADVRLAFVVQRDEFVRVLCSRIGVAQSHGQVRGIASAQAVCGNTAGQRSDERQLDRFLCTGCAAGEHEHQKRCKQDGGTLH